MVNSDIYQTSKIRKTISEQVTLNKANAIKETIIQKNLFREEIKYDIHCVSQLLKEESCFCTTDLIGS
jgi:hypothetical protein